ncbi:MAG: DUF934 domain-containing protein [Allosphingosinicella sp.]
MPLLDRQGWKEEAWDRADPEAAAAIVMLDALEAALAARRPGQRIGVDLPNDVHPERLRAVQDQLDLVSIPFPRFSDGRGFSLGRMLREQGYRGALRAAGWIIPDQFGFALQCGFDEVEIDDEQARRQPIEHWLHAPGLISDSYHNTQDGTVSIFRRRRAAAGAA